jgi:multidrug transporter EmrE-like cation transporter
VNPYWAVLLGAIAVSMVGQTLLKSGARAPDFIAQLLNWHSIIGLGLYGLAAMLYMVALRRIPISVALPATAISYIAAALIGHYGFGESLGGLHIAGIGLIGAGVVMLAFA